ncbi:hypothetical protein N9W84_00920 [bacterium]|nr:hypothetical protein [bacterium]
MSKIYDNQKRTATIMLDRWKGERKPILLVAQCQSGKTGAMLGLCDELIKMKNNWKGDKILYRWRSRPQEEISLFLMGPSDTALKDQTLKRFRHHKTDLFEDGRVAKYIWDIINKEYNCKLKSPYFHYGESAKVRRRFFQRISYILNSQKLAVVLFDECHVGAGKGATIDDLAIRNGVCLGKNVLNKSCKDNELIVLCSATPGTQTYGISAYDLMDKYHICYLKPGAGYYGVSNFIKDGRVNSCFKPEKDQDRFIEEVIDPFLSGECGSFILRFGTAKTYGKCQKILSYLEAKGVPVTEYSSDKDNISDLCQDIYSDRGIHSFRIIYQSYKQGQTLTYKLPSGKEVDCRNFIRGWFDKDNHDNVATHIQSVGRNFGYGISNLTYPIWCNEKYLKDSESYYNYIERLSDKNISDRHFRRTLKNLDRVMTDCYTSDEVHTNSSAYCDEIMSHTHSKRKKDKRGSYYIEVLGVFDEYAAAENYFYKNNISLSLKQNTTISRQNAQDVADDLIKGVKRLNDEKDYHIVDCTSGNSMYLESFNRLATSKVGGHILYRKFAVIKYNKRISKFSIENNSAYSSSFDNIMSNAHSSSSGSNKEKVHMTIVNSFDTEDKARSFASDLFSCDKSKINKRVVSVKSQDVADDIVKNNFRFGKATKELPGIIIDCTRPHKDYVYSYNLLKDYEQYDHINAPCVGKFLVVKFKKYNSKKVYTNNSSYAK